MSPSTTHWGKKLFQGVEQLMMTFKPHFKPAEILAPEKAREGSGCDKAGLRGYGRAGEGD